jgi:putative two-component system response regulator
MPATLIPAAAGGQLSSKIEELLQSIPVCHCDAEMSSRSWLSPDPLPIKREPCTDDVFDSRILVVDDEPVNAKLVRKYLQSYGYRDVTIQCEPLEVIPTMLERPCDLVLLDVVMPGMSGREVLTQMRQTPELREISVIVLTTEIDRKTRLDMLSRGATDFLAKPVDPVETATRIRNALVNAVYRRHWRTYAAELEQAVSERSQSLVRAQFEQLRCLARAAEFRDDETGQHVIRVGRFAALLANRIGMDSDFVDMIRNAAQLHDVGKIGIPDSILLKPGKLSEAEFSIMKEHCRFGTGIFGVRDDIELISAEKHGDQCEDDSCGCKSPLSELSRSEIGLNASLLRLATSPLTRMAALIALTHHEKWDGSGYPLGLIGEDIPLEGRLTAIADVFDALSSARPYKPAFSFDRCFEIIEEGRGKHFDPTLVDAFLACRDEVIRIRQEYPE